MATLTRQEKAWLNKLQKILDECPFDASDFDSYTIGDCDVTVFKQRVKVAQYQMESERDLPACVEALDAEVFRLQFPFGVVSAAG